MRIINPKNVISRLQSTLVLSFLFLFNPSILILFGPIRSIRSTLVIFYPLQSHLVYYVHFGPI